MYPQYSGATTGTVLDEAYAALTAMRWHPAIRTLPAYHDDAGYIGALKTSIEASLAALDFEPEAIPYHCHCQKTARLLSEAMDRDLVISFQSRFGRAKWLEPATDHTLMRLAREGTKKVAIFAPGFSVDCLETLEELAMQGHEQFEEAGGTHYAYLPCLNDSPVGMDMVETIVRRELAGWM